MKYEVLNEVQQSLLVDRYSRQSGLTQSYTLDGKQLKRFIDTRNWSSDCRRCNCLKQSHGGSFLLVDFVTSLLLQERSRGSR
jgi:hypothetical protein